MARAFGAEARPAAGRGRGLAAPAGVHPGQPLTITVLVGQALRDGLTKKDQIEAFVSQLRAGEAAFDD